MSFIENLRQDARFGVRTLRKNPGFTALAVLTLALGIGANTAIFSVINGVLLQPLPYHEPDRIVQLTQRAPGIGLENMNFSIKEVMEYRDQLGSLDSLVEYHSMSFTLLSHGEPDRVLTGVVSHNFFDMLGIAPLHGRSFVASDDELGSDAVLMLSYEYWQQKFGGDPDIVGQVFEMNSRPHTVVGVLPPFPQHPRTNDVYMPTVSCPFRAAGETRMEENRGSFRALVAFGRLADHTDMHGAGADAATVSGRFATDFPDTYPENSGFAASPVLLFEQLTENARPMLMILLGTSGLVLLIACANVANLTLSRMAGREREIAVRTAMGAGRGRLLGQLITEGTMLSLAGGVLGLLVASQGVSMLTTFVSGFTPRVQQIGIDVWVLAFTLGVALLTGVAFGAFPALASRGDLVTSLKDGGAQSTSGGASLRLRSGLIVAQVAVSFVLVVGAGLMLNSFYKLSQIDPGFQGDNVVTAEAFPNWSKFPDATSRRLLFTDILERLESSPGVNAAAVTNFLPMVASFGQPQRFDIEGQMLENPDMRPQVTIRTVTPGYFEAIGVPLLAGRVFTNLDNEDRPVVAVVNQSMAESNWGTESPVGRRISFDQGQNWIEVVGVIADVRQNGVDTEPPQEVYAPAFQTGNFGGFLMVRSNAEPALVIEQLRNAVHGADPEQPVENFRTLEDIRSTSIATPRVTATLLGLFGGIALLITLVGIAGVIATAVSQRTQEFGIRMALGAQRNSVMQMVLRQGLFMVGIGLVIGLLGAVALGRVLSGLLYDTAPTDPFTFVAVALLFGAAAVIACFVPARRATNVDPIIALKAD